MEKKYKYMVKRDGDLPTLLRLDPDENYQAYILTKEIPLNKNFYWVYTPGLDDILTHKDHFPEYTEISEEDAEAIMRQYDAENDRIEKELTTTQIKHTKRKTEDGIVDVTIYHKASDMRSFSLAEYIDILYECLGKKYTILSRIDYWWYDEWGYKKIRAITRKMDIPQIIEDDPQEVVARFSDDMHKYILRAPFMFRTIELEKVPKKPK